MPLFPLNACSRLQIEEQRELIVEEKLSEFEKEVLRVEGITSLHVQGYTYNITKCTHTNSSNSLSTTADFKKVLWS